jgi:hypothetical protein
VVAKPYSIQELSKVLRNLLKWAPGNRLNSL